MNDTLLRSRRTPWKDAAESRRGGALILSLFAVMTVTFLGAAYLNLSASTTARQIRATDNKRAFYVAEAGLSEAYMAALIGKTGEVGSIAEPARYGDGLFWVEVEDHGNGRKTFESTGMCGSGRAVLAITLEGGAGSVAALGIFTKEPLDIPSGSVIDAYDSREGTYADQVAAAAGGGGGGGGLIGGIVEKVVADEKLYQSSKEVLYGTELEDYIAELEVPALGSNAGARIGSNGSVTVREDPGATTEIHGDVRPGMGETLNEVGDPYIAGVTLPLNVPVRLPPVDVPVCTSQPGIENTSAVPMILTSGSHAYDYLNVGPDSQVTLQGPMTLIVDDLSVAARAELEFDTDQGAIEVYVSDQLSFGRNSIVSMTGTDTKDVTVQVGGVQDTSLRAQGQFFGTIYAPQSKAQIGSGWEHFGSLIGNELEFLGPANVHFDRGLSEFSELAGLPQFLSWRLVEMADPMAAGGVHSADPFEALGVSKAACKPPAEAHKDQVLQIKYYDLSGTAQSYDGPEGLFDWDQVRQVLYIQRDGVVPGAVDGLAGLGGVGGRSGIAGLNGIVTRT